MPSATTQTERILEDLMKETATAQQSLESRSRRTEQITEAFEEIRDKIDQATSIKDERRRSERLKILEADLEQLRTDALQEERDLAAAVFGLNSQIEQLGAEYSKLSELNASENALIGSAKQELADAQDQLQRANRAWFFRGSKIRKAEAAIQTAEQNVKTAEAEARRRQRQRLLSANLEASLQEIQLRAAKTSQIMKQRREEIKKQVVAVQAEKNRLLDYMKKAAKAVEEFDALIESKTAELRQAEERLTTLEHGSDEHAAQTKKVSNLKAELEELIGGRNTAVTRHQSAHKFSTELEVHEQAQIRLRDNLQMWITALEADTEARVVTFRSRLEAMKATSDQEVAKSIDDLGAEVDQRNVAAMGAMGAASDRARVDRFRRVPDRIRAINEIAIAQIQARAKVEAAMEELLAEWRDKYGIDPMATSYFTQADAGKGGDTEKS